MTFLRDQTEKLPFPPASLMFMGETEEKAVCNGDTLLQVVDGLYDNRGLILDIGCGYGRLAYALYRKGFEGDYIGYDVKGNAIGWLTDNFTALAPGYRFIHTDVQNDRYNPKGGQTATDLRLGELPQAPTLILLLSVFTHMYGEDIARYLETIATVMDDRTLLYVTFFLLNPEQQALEAAGRTTRPFPHITSEHCRSFSLQDPLWAVAFSDQWVDRTVGSAGLRIEKKLYGSWAGRRDARVFQDTVFVRKA